MGDGGFFPAPSLNSCEKSELLAASACWSIMPLLKPKTKDRQTALQLADTSKLQEQQHHHHYNPERVVFIIYVTNSTWIRQNDRNTLHYTAIQKKIKLHQWHQKLPLSLINTSKKKSQYLISILIQYLYLILYSECLLVLYCKVQG